MNKYRFFKSLICTMSSIVISGFCIMPLSASATTKQDVINVARNVGMPEDLIGYYTNLGENIEVTSEQCDKAIQKLYQIYGVTNDKIQEDFDVTINNSTSTDTSQTDTTSQIETTISNDNNSEFISQDEFINMDYQGKIDYVNSLAQEDKESFMNNLSTSARNSIIKQLDIDAKTDIVASIVDAGKAMGYNLAVDEITDDKIELSIRDQEGTLIGVTKMGVTIDNTGKDYSLLVGVCLSTFIILSIILVKISKKLRDEEFNE